MVQIHVVNARGAMMETARDMKAARAMTKLMSKMSVFGPNPRFATVISPQEPKRIPFLANPKVGDDRCYFEFWPWSLRLRLRLIDEPAPIDPIEVLRKTGQNGIGLYTPRRGGPYGTFHVAGNPVFQSGEFKDIKEVEVEVVGDTPLLLLKPPQWAR